MRSWFHLAAAVALVTGCAQVRMTTVARGPVQLDSAGFVVRLRPASAREIEYAKVCVIFDTTRYVAGGFGTGTLRARRASDTVGIPQDLPSPDTTIVIITARLDSGDEHQTDFWLPEQGYGAIPRVCLMAPKIRQDAHSLQVRLFSSKPIVVHAVTWTTIR